MAAKKNTLKGGMRAAVRCYIARQERKDHPSGEFDKAGRFYPAGSTYGGDGEEWQECCAPIRTPSRSWPYTYMTHCRSLPHVANLYGVDAVKLRRKVREMKQKEEEAEA